MTNTANLFKRYKTFLTTDNWIDVKRIEQLRDDDFEKKFGNRPDHNRPTFFGELKKQAINLFAENEYQLLTDSNELSPFDSSGMVDFLVFEKGNKQIKITQVDWRDDYFIYRIEVNSKNVFEIDIRNQDTSSAVESMLIKLRQQL